MAQVGLKLVESLQPGAPEGAPPPRRKSLQPGAPDAGQPARGEHHRPGPDVDRSAFARSKPTSTNGRAATIDVSKSILGQQAGMPGSRANGRPVQTALECAPSCPRHVAIVMDGNNRWAKGRSMPRAAGHLAGTQNLKRVAQACADRGVECLTLFAFSTENWRRPRREVKVLLDLMRGVLREDIEELNEKGAQLRFIGDRRRFPADLQQLMTDAEQRTAHNDRLHLAIAVNYGGRWDIVQAARRIAEAACAGDLDPADINEGDFAAFLSLGDLPPPDLCIRTGGDRRISNFLLWDFAYTEFYFTGAFWPDFDAEQLDHAFEDFASRQRRYGKRTLS